MFSVKVISCGLASLPKKGPAFVYEEWQKSKMDKGEWLNRDKYYKLQIFKHRRIIGEINRRLNWSKNVPILPEKYEIDPTRKIILDTETTGLMDSDGIVELSMIETYNGVKSGRFFHTFFNPLTTITAKATAIHKLTDEKVADFPTFPEKAKEIIDFIGTSYVVAHNAGFDMRMLNNELIRWDYAPFPKFHFIDTLAMARFLYPKQGNKQDDLCVRYNIDNKLRMATGIHSAMEDTVHLYKIFVILCEKLRENGKCDCDFVLDVKKRKLDD